MDRGIQSGGPYPRPEDIKCFLGVYRRAMGEGFARHTSYRSLLGEKRYTTLLSQLRRIADFANSIDPEASKRGHSRGGSEGQPLHLLFSRRGVGEGGLQPTEIAHALFRVFSPLMDGYENLKRKAVHLLRMPELRREVRGGAAPNFSHHVCPFILSQWREKEVFGELLNLSWTSGNTADLLPKLDAGDLDFVVGYGLEDRQSVPQAEMHVAFSSFGYDSKAILACHPTEALWLANVKVLDHNKGYYGFLRSCKEKDGERPPAYEQLKEVKLEDLDVARTKLIVARSWRPSPRKDATMRTTGMPVLDDFIEDATSKGMKVHYVDSYDEAAARVRLAFGVAVLPEVYSKRRMINPFRLEPREHFTRWIGAYYSTRFPLTQEAYTVLEFLRQYFEDFECSVRNGHPIRYGDLLPVKAGDRVQRDFTQWCRDFRIEGDWLAGAREKYRLGGLKDEDEVIQKRRSSGKKRAKDDKAKSRRRR